MRKRGLTAAAAGSDGRYMETTLAHTLGVPRAWKCPNAFGCSARVSDFASTATAEQHEGGDGGPHSIEPSHAGLVSVTHERRIGQRCHDRPPTRICHVRRRYDKDHGLVMNRCGANGRRVVHHTCHAGASAGQCVASNFLDELVTHALEIHAPDTW